MSSVSKNNLRDIEKKPDNKAYYHREYKHDLEHVSSNNYYIQQAKRISLVALPFISLYKPAGTALSVVMNSTRTLSSFAQTYKSFCNGNIDEIGLALFNVFISMSSVAGTLFKSSYGMVISSSHDVLLNLYQVNRHIQTGNYQEAFEEFKSLTNNSFYLALLLKGSLEILVASMAIQVLLGLNNSYKEFSKGNNLEGFGHLAMSSIRGYQLQPNVKMLQFKWKLEKLINEQTNMIKSSDIAAIGSSSLALPIIKISEQKNIPEIKLTNQELKDLSAEEIFSKTRAAIREGNLELFLSLEKNCENWSQLSSSDLSRITYILFTECLDYNEIEKNKYGIIMLEKIVIQHPNADISVRSLFGLLEDLSCSGNVDAFKMLITKHPRSVALRDEDLVNLIKETHQSALSPGAGAAENFKIRKKNGKDEIARLLIKHNNWNTTSPYLLKELFCFLIRRGFLSSSLRIELFDEFFKYQAWQDLDTNMITSIAQSAVITWDLAVGNNAFMKIKTHPKWNELNSNHLTWIAKKLFSKIVTMVNYDEEEAKLAKINYFNLLETHPNWDKLNSNDLCEILSSFKGNFIDDMFDLLSKHINWKNLSENELQIVFGTLMSNYSINCFLLLTEHPNWNNINKDHMAEAALMAANRGFIDYLERITEHPTWKDFTVEDLKEIMEWSHWTDEFPEIKEILSKHERWNELTSEDLIFDDD